jgi:hypothetical protein
MKTLLTMVLLPPLSSHPPALSPSLSLSLSTVTNPQKGTNPSKFFQQKQKKEHSFRIQKGDKENVYG